MFSNRLQFLTERELEIMKLISEGWTNGYIERVMFISRRTVGRHINSIFSKLEVSKNKDVSPRVAAAIYFLRNR